ncbi:hypothetical protein M419DRAFT_25208 [Trichoderma reesei RUT C-30]|uniref:Uncharacterized protein n=1 Tax=Hypocrea jecorina (strain ATCC 56765 / BCRC 32924 / NRRL 11460 / Rut C-30) TaxID=1344414 RepID=A0A024SBN3_HYPJR|nr:hypothetical protein M419DRAFT_25208 [Trichoderma reesei RUT C-30]
MATSIGHCRHHSGKVTRTSGNCSSRLSSITGRSSGIISGSHSSRATCTSGRYSNKSPSVDPSDSLTLAVGSICCSKSSRTLACERLPGLRHSLPCRHCRLRKGLARDLACRQQKEWLLPLYRMTRMK